MFKFLAYYFGILFFLKGFGIGADYWYTLIESLPDLKIFSPFRLNDWEWGSFLKKRPDLEAKCPFKSLGKQCLGRYPDALSAICRPLSLGETFRR